MTGPKGGWTASRRFRLGAAASILLGLVLAATAALLAAPGGPAAPAAVARDADRPAVAASSIAQAPLTAASSWSMAPVAAAPAPAPAVAPAAAALAAGAEASYRIDILTDGQDWGRDEAGQAQNIGAVTSAMDRLPVTVASSVAQSPAGRLAVLSNAQGRTRDGWQPYGDAARSFYTNSDQGPAGPGSSHEIVLATGAGRMSVAHELLHAHQFRGVAPGDYVLALLGEEMRSFAQATGWRQTVSDDAVRAAAHESWQTVSGLYVDEGRPLTYTDERGAAVTVHPANPLEAFATAGAIYYARPDAVRLPDWPEYWAWFDARLGPPRDMR